MFTCLRWVCEVQRPLSRELICLVLYEKTFSHTDSALKLCRFINALYETPVSEQSLETGRRLFLHGCLQAATTASAGSSGLPLPTKHALVIAPHIPPLFICRYMSACATIGDRPVQVLLGDAGCLQ